MVLLDHASGDPAATADLDALISGPRPDITAVLPACFAWVAWFRTERLHSELGDRTPAETEDRYRHDPQPTAA